MARSLLNMELLAPAGGMEQLQAAVRFGADAVYLAADRFGMRARATNFALDAVDEAVRYAHDHGVKVYAACNVLMKPDDIDALPPYLRALDEAGVDALIVGDMGAFALAREYAPDVSLHVSTQASVANAAAARTWYSLGARRVVCAREMSLNDIARMREDVPDDLELEVFVHGAMCMAISGRCLISAYLTGRSGNEGDCSQPCRWKYALEEEKRPGVYFPIDEDERGSFILNAKDLNMIAHLDELAAAGVNAIKIEGRNKKAFYVASVVGAYRHVLDGGDVNDAEEELLAVSHRPYGTGFYFGEAQQASDFEGYEQQTIHVADVLDCREADTLDGAVGDAAGHGAGGDAVGAADGGAVGAAVGAVGAAGGGAAVTGDAGGGAAGDADGGNKKHRREQCRETDDQASKCQERCWILTVRCRNRFEESDELEVLRPHEEPARIVVHDLAWLTQDDAANSAQHPEPVAVANRASELYSFVAQGLDIPVEEGSFLRMREYRRSTGDK